MLFGILCCILAGVANTLNRVLNARLVEKSGFYSAMTFSFFTGMIFVFFAYLATKSAFPIPEPLTRWQDNWVVIGVVPSVFTCLLFTLVAAKIPVLSLRAHLCGSGRDSCYFGFRLKAGRFHRLLYWLAAHHCGHRLECDRRKAGIRKPAAQTGNRSIRFEA